MTRRQIILLSKHESNLHMDDIRTHEVSWNPRNPYSMLRERIKTTAERDLDSLAVLALIWRRGGMKRGTGELILLTFKSFSEFLSSWVSLCL